MRPPFKAEVVGSLLRPANIKELRDKVAQGQAMLADLKAAEDKAVADNVAMQKEVGLAVCTDGEARRRHWFLDFLEKIDGVEVHGGMPVKFHNEKGDGEFSPPRFEVHGKIKRSKGLAVDEFKALKPLADKAGLVAKQPIPSPMCIHFRGGRAAIDKAVYPDIEEFFADLAQVYREEIQALYDAGCRYLQIDDTNLPFLCDPALRENVKKMGEDPDTLPQLYVKMINDALRDKPADLVTGLHMCRGNHASSWVAEGGYDPVAEIVFGDMNVDAFFLEYDSPRAGGFAPLRFLNKKKVAVLGLITTKKPDMENKQDMVKRINEASQYVPLERISFSAQCGFASTIAGNSLTFDDQRNKLKLVVDVAKEVWGTN